VGVFELAISPVPVPDMARSDHAELRPVSVQTMTAGYTHDDRCLRRGDHKLAAAGADVVRVAVPEKKDTEALPEILPTDRVPIVADVHFHFKRALEAVEAGVHKIRLNPGNISDREQVARSSTPARNGPAHPRGRQRGLDHRAQGQAEARSRNSGFSSSATTSTAPARIMIAKLEEYLDIFYAATSTTSRSAPSRWTRRS
jgi:(E)-4-hydroxy-3-methylbut-2-enyl-diphosphate synthase